MANNKLIKIINFNLSDKVHDDFCQLFIQISNTLKSSLIVENKKISSINLIDKDTSIILLEADMATIRKIKHTNPQTELLLVNIEEDYQLAINAFRNGVDDVLSYPFKENELLPLVKQFSNLKSATTSSSAAAAAAAAYACGPGPDEYSRTNLKGLLMLTHIDDVTGLFNQRKLYLDLDIHIKRYQEINEIFSILFIDIDHFKYVNDNFGHLVGSSILVEISKIFKKLIRESDLMYRYGGDEFVIILPNVGFDLAYKVASRILRAVGKNKFKTIPTNGHSSSIVPKQSVAQELINLTVSIGIAEYPRDAKTREDIIDFADRMMYQAKGNGRSQVYYTNQSITSRVTS
ncbi:MAG: GGDEF domain-containing protein [Oligoflexia bacterium]|nr:GGDEF domain-containing protein [Oligoflexia bacterium]